MARTVVKWGLLAFVAVTFAVIVWQEATGRGTSAAVTFEPGDYLLVTYFHGDKRCKMCNDMEAFTAEALDRLAVRSLRRRTLNWQSPENAAWARHYELLGNAVIVTEVRGGREVRFKNLDAVWDHAHDREAFVAYVSGEVQPWLPAGDGGGA